MRIGKVAERAGVGVETVRFYERMGLVERPRKPIDGGYRAYPAEAVDRIRFVRQAQRLGFSLKEVEELLLLRSDPSTECADVRERAQTKLDEVNRKIADLAGIRGVLEDLVHRCKGDGPAADSCPILEALEPDRKVSNP
jgi:MerR family mercuric resistance operon transcriptional regulator